MNKRQVLILLFLLCATLVSAESRHALLVGISRYDKQATGWGTIHGAEDVSMVAQGLKGFSVTRLCDSKATYSGIMKALERLVEKAHPGDIIYLHFSGHGQPVEDSDGDEPDGWDESFVPYDAPMYFRKGVYEGERHLTDDRLHGYLMRLRSKVGPKGMVYCVVDACHSGESYRDDDNNTEEPPTRGSAIGFSPRGKIYVARNARSRKGVAVSSSATLSPIVMLESCLSSQRSMEYRYADGKYCGPLSYAVCKVLRERKATLSTNPSWVVDVRKYFQTMMPSYNPQQLVIETTEQTLLK